MIKEIICDEALLQQVAEAATIEDAGIAQDLLDTMASLENCACLSASQIGANKAIIAYLDEQERPHVMYNPSIAQSAIAYKAVENCLSLKRDTEVKRFRRITVAYQMPEGDKLTDRKRKLQEWTAEVVQHAIDHCNGILV